MKNKGKNYANRKPENENGLVECGMIVSCFFIWNKYYNGYPKIKVLDMQKYIKQKSKIKVNG